jgi:hypothetical protein
MTPTMLIKDLRGLKEASGLTVREISRRMGLKDGKHIATYCLHARDFVDEMLACEKGEAEFNVIEKEKGNKR